MSDVKVYNTKLCGTFDVAKNMPSKSILHREIICSALGGGSLNIEKSCDDVNATAQSINAILHGDKHCFVHDSASTLRFLIPLAIAKGGAVFHISDGLKRRLTGGYSSILKNATFDLSGNELTVGGKIFPGEYVIDANISSQFVSGMLFGLSVVGGQSVIKIKNAVSEPYIGLTTDSMIRHGAKVRREGNDLIIDGNSKYIAGEIYTEGDFSNAAVLIVANKLGSKITLTGLNANSRQGDSAIIDLIEESEIDITQTPDLFPILCVNACGREGKTIIFGTGRLKYKESDRPQAMQKELTRLGADIKLYDDRVEIIGTGKLKGGVELNSHNDHRVAMTLVIAATICDEPIIIKGADCVKKSCPEFYDYIKLLGGRVQ